MIKTTIGCWKCTPLNCTPCTSAQDFFKTSMTEIIVLVNDNFRLFRHEMANRAFVGFSHPFSRAGTTQWCIFMSVRLTSSRGSFIKFVTGPKKPLTLCSKNLAHTVLSYI